MPNDRSTLLKRLRIERADERQTHYSWLVWSTISLVVLGAAVRWLAIPRGIPIAVAEVKVVGEHVAGASSKLSILEASGYVVAHRRATVASKITGRVTEVLIEEGQKVEKGAVIARLDSSNSRASLVQAEALVAQAEANLQASKVALDDALPIYKRNRLQHKAGFISAQAFDSSSATFNAIKADYLVKQRAVEVARATLGIAQHNNEDTIVRAPFSGVVTVKAAQAGEVVSPISAGGGFTRTGIGTIVDMNSLEVEVEVGEDVIDRVHTSQPVTVRLNAYQNWKIPAEVIAIVPTADRARATVRVRVGLKQADSRILPEMSARVSFLRDTDRDASADSDVSKALPLPLLSVPADAVLVNGETGTVFVVQGETVERRVITLGTRTNEGQIVTSGLTKGTQIAASNLSQLFEGARIKIKK
jgi:RND family efflux transporter MFP subunit